MLRRAYRKMRFGALLLKTGGLGLFFHQLRRQVYSRASFIGLERDLDVERASVACRESYLLRLASEADMEEVQGRAKREGKAETHELIQRTWFYESGFHDCYVARSAENGDLFHICWLLSSRDDSVVNAGFRGRLPTLKPDEVLIENAYTFEEFRGRRIYPSVLADLAEVARRAEFKRMLVYVRDDNVASLKGCFRASFRPFEQVHELKLLLYTSRNHTRGGGSHPTSSSPLPPRRGHRIEGEAEELGTKLEI